MIDIRHLDERVIVCIKPAGVLSTDEEGGLPQLLQEQLGLEHRPRTVHRLDQVVSGLMVLARGAKSASILSEQVMGRSFGKEYLAVIHGCPAEKKGTLVDLLGRDKARRMTYVAQEPGKGIQDAVLDYEVLAQAENLSLVHITLHTGRTHQIRVQFSSRGMPLVGERKYSTLEDDCTIALWSHRLQFDHPFTGESMEFRAIPPAQWPWNLFHLV
jgi:23S rRNA pseudouridine1911/1915/1917 synthase